MSQPWTAEKLSEVKAQLFRRAATDEAFRQLCLKDAHAAVKMISGMDLPAGERLRLVEKRDEIVWVLPQFEKASELSDQDLAEVAGGEEWVTYNLYCSFSGVSGSCGY